MSPPPHFATFMVPNVQLSKMKEGGGGRGVGKIIVIQLFYLPSNIICYVLHVGVTFTSYTKEK